MFSAIEKASKENASKNALSYPLILSFVFLLHPLIGQSQSLPTETEVSNDQGNPLPIEGTVIVGNQQPIDVVDRPTANGFVLSTEFTVEDVNGLANTDTRRLAPDRVSYLYGVTLSAIRFDPTSFCKIQVLYDEDDLMPGVFGLPAGQTDPVVATAVFGPPNGTVHITTPPLLVGDGQGLLVAGSVFDSKVKDARCRFNAELLFRRRTEIVVPQ